MIDKVAIGKIIQKLRNDKKLTQEELAEKVDISTNYLSKVERGLGKLNVESFLKMAEVLSFNFEDFGINTQHTQDELSNKIIYKILGTSEKKKVLYLKALNFIDDITK